MWLNLHQHKAAVLCLDMIRIEKSIKAKKSINITEKKLYDFGMNLQNHTVDMVTDEASVMVKLGRISSVMS